MSRKLALPLAFALALTAAACGDDDDTTTDTPDTGDEVASCEAGSLPVKEDGALTVATGEPAFEPWMVDDDPTNGEGYEAAVVYAVAEELGFAEDAVTWVRTGFDEAIAPGEKRLRLQRPAVLHHPRARRGRRLLRRLLRDRAGARGPGRQRHRLGDLHRRPPGRHASAPPSAPPPSTTSRRSSSPTPSRWSSTTTPPPRPPSTPTRSTASSSTSPPRTTSPPSRSRTPPIVGVLPLAGRRRGARVPLRGRQPAGRLRQRGAGHPRGGRHARASCRSSGSTRAATSPTLTGLTRWTRSTPVPHGRRSSAPAPRGGRPGRADRHRQHRRVPRGGGRAGRQQPQLAQGPRPVLRPRGDSASRGPTCSSGFWVDVQMFAYAIVAIPILALLLASARSFRGPRSSRSGPWPSCSSTCCAASR